MKKLMILFAIVLGLFLGGSQGVLAYDISVDTFQSGYGFTGEITYHLLPSGATMPTYCIQRDVNVNVPGEYDVAYSAISGGLIQAAYLIETYTPYWNGAYTGYSDVITDFPISGTTFDLYQIFMADVGTPTGTWLYADLFIGDVQYQDLLVRSSVPEPTTMLLLGFGLLSLGLVRRKNS